MEKLVTSRLCELRTITTAIGLVALFSLTFHIASSAQAQAETLEWIRQFGTSGFDESYGISADRLGRVYISGYTGGALVGASAGSWDAFVSTYDARGVIQWTRQFGDRGTDIGFAVASNGTGSVYVTGSNKTLRPDVFLSKYDASGLLQWTRQLHTPDGERGSGVSADGRGNVYVSGFTGGRLEGPNAGEHDGFVAKYDEEGIVEWIRQFGTPTWDEASDLSVDGQGNVYVAGSSRGDVGGPNAGDYDVFLSKYDANGTLQWSRQFGTNRRDNGPAVTVDQMGNVYVSANKFISDDPDDPHNPDWDSILNKYDASGTLLWTREFGTDREERTDGISTDRFGNIFLTGRTAGSLDGANNGGSADVFIRKYNADGALEWAQQFGTPEWDVGYDLSSDGLGNVYVSGTTRGSLGALNAGSRDVFVAKFTTGLPEPVADFDNNGDVNVNDVDALVDEIVKYTYDFGFDLNGDAIINIEDLNQWRSDAATANGFADPYLPGDANLDGSVDAADLNHLAPSWLQDVARWSAGDFTADGRVNAADLNELAANWQGRVNATEANQSVPEPSSIVLLLLVLLGFVRFAGLK